MFANQQKRSEHHRVAKRAIKENKYLMIKSLRLRKYMETDSKSNKGVDSNSNKINLKTDVVKKLKMRLKRMLKEKSNSLGIIIKIMNQPVNISLGELLNNSNQLQNIFFKSFLKSGLQTQVSNINFKNINNNKREAAFKKQLYITIYFKIRIIIDGENVLTLINTEAEITVIL
jgi:hypothetical protein